MKEKTQRAREGAEEFSGAGREPAPSTPPRSLCPRRDIERPPNKNTVCEPPLKSYPQNEQ